MSARMYGPNTANTSSGDTDPALTRSTTRLITYGLPYESSATNRNVDAIRAVNSPKCLRVTNQK